MRISLYSALYPDKYVNHPVLGEITCSGYLEAFKRCSELLDSANKFHIQCINLHEISSSLYTWPFSPL